MKSTIPNLIVVTALSFGGAALAAGEAENEAQSAAQPATAPAAQPAAAPASTPTTSAPEASPKRPAPNKHTKAKQPRSMTLDLRHCLDLDNNAAIANCAGE